MADRIYTIAVKADVSQLNKAIQKAMRELEVMEQNTDIGSNINMTDVYNALKKELDELRTAVSKINLDKIDTHVIDTGPIEKLLEQFKAINTEIEMLNTNLNGLDFSKSISDITGALENLKNTYAEIENMFGLKKNRPANIDVKTQVSNLKELMKLQNSIRYDKASVADMFADVSKDKSKDNINNLIDEYYQLSQQLGIIEDKIQSTEESLVSARKNNDISGIARYTQHLISDYDDYQKIAKKMGTLYGTIYSKDLENAFFDDEANFNLEVTIQKQLQKIAQKIPQLISDIRQRLESQKINVEEILLSNQQNKLKIPISMELGKGSLELKNEVDNILDSIRNSVSNKPIEIGIRLVSKYRTPKVTKKELEDQKTLEDNVIKLSSREIKFHIKSDIKAVREDIDEEITAIEGILNGAELKLPTIVLPDNFQDITAAFKEMADQMERTGLKGSDAFKQVEESAKQKTKARAKAAKEAKKAAKEATKETAEELKIDTKIDAEIETKINPDDKDKTKETADVMLKTVEMVKEQLQPLLNDMSTELQEKFGESFTNIGNGFRDFSENGVAAISSLSTALQGLAALMKTVFDIPAEDALNKQWSSIKQKFNQLVTDKGTIDARKKDLKPVYQKMIEEMYDYESKGGTHSIKDLTGDARTIRKVNSAINDFKIDNNLVVQVRILHEAINRLTSALEEFSQSGEAFGKSAKSMADNIGKIMKAIDAAKSDTDLTTKDKKSAVATAGAKLETAKRNLTNAQQDLDDAFKIEYAHDEAAKLEQEFKEVADEIDTIRSKPLDLINADDLAQLKELDAVLKRIIKDYNNIVKNKSFDISNKSGEVKIDGIDFTSQSDMLQEVQNLVKEQMGDDGIQLGSLQVKNSEATKGVVTFTTEVRTAQGEVKELKYEVDGALGTIRELTTIKTTNDIFDALQQKSQKLQTSIMDSMRTLESGITNMFDTADLDADFDPLENKIPQVDAILNEILSKMSLLKNEYSGLLSQTTFEDIDYSRLQELSQRLSELVRIYNQIAKGDAFDLQNKAGLFVTQSDSLFGDPRKATEYVDSYVKSLEGYNETVQEFTETNLHGTGISKITGQIKLQSGEIQTLVFSYDKLNNIIRMNGSVTRQAMAGVEAMASSIKGLFSVVSMYLSAADVIMKAVQLIRDGIDEIKNLDVAFTEMQKVSNATNATLERFSKQSFNIAGSISSTGLEIQQSSADWMRLGYSIKEAGELAKNSALYANVGDMNIDTATEHLLSSVKAFREEFASEVEASVAIVDKFNEIGNNYAISSADIGDSLENSAAALVAAGNSLDQAIGLTTAANLIQQDASAVGNALKVVSLRTRGAKTELEEMGEDTDGLAGSTSKLREELLSLTGVDILKNGGSSFKSTYEIFDEISQVWDNLSDLSQANVLEKLAGKTRSAVVVGLIENFQTARDVVKSAEQAMGSATEENKVFQASIEGHLEQLSNKWQEMWANSINRDTINFVLDLGTALIGVADTLGLMSTLLGGISFLGLTQGGGRGKMPPLCK